MGPEGLKNAAVQSCSKAHYLKEKLVEAGFEKAFGDREFFHEFVTECPGDVQEVMKQLESEGILGGLPLEDNRILWCVTEKSSKEDLDKLVSVLSR